MLISQTRVGPGLCIFIKLRGLIKSAINLVSGPDSE